MPTQASNLKAAPPSRALAGLRIAIVAPSVSALGGSEEYLRTVVPALSGAGASVRLFSAANESGAEIRERALAATLHPFKRAKNARAVADFADELAACADIVDFQRVAPLELVKALKRRVTTVLTVHTAEQTCPAGARYLPRSGGLCDRKPGVACIAQDRREGCLCFSDGKRFSLRDRAHSLLQLRNSAKLAKHIDYAIYNSNATRACFERFVGVPRGSVIYPPLLAQAHGAVGGPPTGGLIYVGRIEAFKGVFDLPEVLAAQDESVTLEIFGTGSALGELQEPFDNVKLARRVTFRGWRSREEVAQGLARASCLLFPTRGFEAWGMTGPEAIAQGCPVVAYDSGGVREWCMPEFGTVVPLGDVDAMARAAKHWLARTADRSSWYIEATQRWGMKRWLGEYAAAVAEART